MTWFSREDSGSDIDKNVEMFLKNKQRAKDVDQAGDQDSLFAFLKPMTWLRRLRASQDTQENSVLSSLRARLAREPDNEYLKQAIRDQESRENS